MILFELVINIIKYVKVFKVYLKLEWIEKEFILIVRDDGCGFIFIKGDDFYIVWDCVFLFLGEVKVIS